MGKGTIISGGEGGLYQIQLNYDETRKTSAIERLTVAIAAMDAKIIAEEDDQKKGIYQLIKVSYEKKLEAVQKYAPENPIIEVWCADLSESLSGVIGTIEVPGEIGVVQIYPGFPHEPIPPRPENPSAFLEDRDGQLRYNYLLPASGSFYNLALLPGWQKWKPTYRYAEITALDGNFADVTLDSEPSSQQGLNINQTATIKNVEIEYLDCNGVAFAEGDIVLIQFSNYDWEQPKIIGFKDHPRSCYEILVVKQQTGFYYDESDYDHLFPIPVYSFVVWDTNLDKPYEILNNEGVKITYPCLIADLKSWFTTVTQTNVDYNDYGEPVYRNLLAGNKGGFTYRFGLSSSSYSFPITDIPDPSGSFSLVASGSNVNQVDYELPLHAGVPMYGTSTTHESYGALNITGYPESFRITINPAVGGSGNVTSSHCNLIATNSSESFQIFGEAMLSMSNVSSESRTRYTSMGAFPTCSTVSTLDYERSTGITENKQTMGTGQDFFSGTWGNRLVALCYQNMQGAATNSGELLFSRSDIQIGFAITDDLESFDPTEIPNNTKLATACEPMMYVDGEVRYWIYGLEIETYKRN